MIGKRFWTWPLALLLVLPLFAMPSIGADKDKKADKAKKSEEKPKYANFTYVPTADEVIDKMFELGKVKKSDIIFDLGCGDARILCQAAKKYGCKGIGVDLNPERIKEAHETVKKYGVEKLVEIRHGDALKQKDIGKATMVVMYMFPEFMNLWLPIAEKELKPGVRILSHDYTWDTEKWAPDTTVRVKSSTREHTVHMWTVKGSKK